MSRITQKTIVLFEIMTRLKGHFTNPIYPAMRQSIQILHLALEREIDKFLNRLRFLRCHGRLCITPIGGELANISKLYKSVFINRQHL